MFFITQRYGPVATDKGWCHEWRHIFAHIAWRHSRAHAIAQTSTRACRGFLFFFVVQLLSSALPMPSRAPSLLCRAQRLHHTCWQRTHTRLHACASSLSRLRVHGVFLHVGGESEARVRKEMEAYSSPHGARSHIPLSAPASGSEPLQWQRMRLHCFCSGALAAARWAGGSGTLPGTEAEENTTR